jgi:penicillin-binding protein-related factor A (putative recombinase)
LNKNKFISRKYSGISFVFLIYCDGNHPHKLSISSFIQTSSSFENKSLAFQIAEFQAYKSFCCDQT